MNEERRRIRNLIRDLTVEDREVQQALREYQIDEEQPTAFCPLNVLYRTYLTYVQGLSWRAQDTRTLTRQQFGIAVRRIFDLTEADKGNCRVDGKYQRGYYCLVGPESVTLLGRPGRRPSEHDYGVETP